MPEATLPTPKRKSYIEEAILISLIILSLIGIFINEFSPADGYGYWVIMVFVFAPFAIIIGWRRSKQRSEDFKSILGEQTLHWLTTLLVVGCVSLVQKSDIQAGRVILLILSLATMLDGMRVGWRFRLIGLFLGFSAVIPTYTEHFFWLEVVIAVVIIVLTLLWEIWSTRKLQS